ncbi:hypothetical protein J6590_027137 [Homalodisca vitripennis]|nr:hypothetical protein J6590_027137 [Homalodisca vitripennis]
MKATSVCLTPTNTALSLPVSRHCYYPLPEDEPQEPVLRNIQKQEFRNSPHVVHSSRNNVFKGIKDRRCALFS